jgi:hypothetical protein
MDEDRQGTKMETPYARKLKLRDLNLLNCIYSSVSLSSSNANVLFIP